MHFNVLDNPSAAQKAEFQFEIEQMKLLGSHPNVVSMVGCCTFQDEKFLVNNRVCSFWRPADVASL